jgi:membrane protease YdiL (CAAX protease family)
MLGGIVLLINHDAESPAFLIASFVGLWIPLIASAFGASKLFGTGSPARDLGLRFEPIDLAWGALTAVAGLMAATAVSSALAPFPRLLGENTGFIEAQKSTAFGIGVVMFSTMIGAPVVEELFFRGLLLRAMWRFGLVAVLVQGALFGLIHVDPAQGLGNVGIVLGVGAFGIVQGFSARFTGRLAPVMISHFLFNSAAVLPLLLR